MSEQLRTGAPLASWRWAVQEYNHAHDLGKALTHKMEDRHHISGEMLRKYGAPV